MVTCGNCGWPIAGGLCMCALNGEHPMQKKINPGGEGNNMDEYAKLHLRIQELEALVGKMALKLGCLPSYADLLGGNQHIFDKIQQLAEAQAKYELAVQATADEHLRRLAAQARIADVNLLMRDLAGIVGDLLNYRNHNTLNFQLEKADDYFVQLATLMPSVRAWLVDEV